jgi:hypothetical protein
MTRPLLRRLPHRDQLRRDLRTAAVALVICTLVTATPSVAAKVLDADSVDGFSAVKATTSATARKGKLVATDSHGRLPDNIIKKAADANRLDGLDSRSFPRVKASRNEVYVGEWGAWGGGAGSFVSDVVPFGVVLPLAIPQSRITVLDEGAPYTAQCPGAGKVTPRLWLCIYTVSQGGVHGLNSYNATDGTDNTSTRGFAVYGNCGDAACWQYGTWALRVGTTADAGTRPAARTGTNPR